MKLLDTTFLVNYERGEEAVAEYLEANGAAEFVTGNGAKAHDFNRGRKRGSLMRLRIGREDSPTGPEAVGGTGCPSVSPEVREQ